MSQPDFERAKRYVLERLARELSPDLAYHSLAHTRDEVLPAVERMAAWEGVSGEALLLLCTAALFHDLGFVEQATDHETISIRIAGEVLPGFGYRPAQIQLIGDIIAATREWVSPRTHLEEIMVDADLDVLGREDFWPRNQALRVERAALGELFSDEAWYRGQLEFMEQHRYHTAAARALRGEGKRRNMQAMRHALARVGVGDMG